MVCLANKKIVKWIILLCVFWKPHGKPTPFLFFFIPSIFHGDVEEVGVCNGFFFRNR